MEMKQSRIVVTGSSGLVGNHLVPSLESSGYEVIRMVRRRPANPSERFWNPESGQIDRTAVHGARAIINLAGVSIAGKRWSSSRKKAILESRVKGTRLLATTISESDCPPEVFISTSAVGYYGDQGSDLLTESSPNGGGFLAAVCEEWEAAADGARDAGIRVVHPRFGVVLAPDGGMLPQIARLFRIGAGGRVGSGHQFMSWIDIDDLVNVLLFAVESPIPGEIINAVAPNPVTNREYTEALGDVLHRPALIPAPAFAVRLILGEMGEELILASQRAVPAALDGGGFTFRYPTIQESLLHAFDSTGYQTTQLNPFSSRSKRAAELTAKQP
jgi:uncharacterized protein (TIGR01777 family)